MRSMLRAGVVVFVLLTLLTGVVYPLAVTGVAQILPSRATGSLIMRDGKAVGSLMLGQEFTDPKYFWGRLSATGPVPYTAFNSDKGTGSSGSNLAPTNPSLIANTKARIEALRAADDAIGYHRPSDQRVPADLVTASGSGLDPHITPAAAEYQIPRVAKARGIDEAAVRTLVERATRPRQLGVLGEPVVHVLDLNLALDTATR